MIGFAGLGIEEASDKAIANLDKSSPSYQLMMSYLDGINQFMEEGLAYRIQLVGVKKEKFTIKDVYNIWLHVF
jgi:penicillin amidase